jgi:copper homeostasis protein
MMSAPLPDRLAPILLEVCVDSEHGLRAAIDGGADRIELCAALEVGGLTPSPGLMHLAADCGVPTRAMIRPRSGAFLFSAGEAEMMLRDIDAARAAGLAGIVIGASGNDGRLDIALLDRLVRHGAGLGITLHRAIDLTPDPVAAVDIAIDLGIDTILTSGGAATAHVGATVIRAMNDRAGGRIVIMAGSGVTADNAGEIVELTGVRAVHGSFARAHPADDPRAVELGFAPPSVKIADARAIAAARLALSQRLSMAGAA